MGQERRPQQRGLLGTVTWDFCAQVSRMRVLQIDRVQNLRLWTKYVIRRNEVRKEGCSQDVCDAVMPVTAVAALTT